MFTVNSCAAARQGPTEAHVSTNGALPDCGNAWPVEVAVSLRNYAAITDLDELAQLLDRIHGNVFGFDIETGYHGPDRPKASLRPETAIVVGISFTDSLDWARYVPVNHDDADNLPNAAVARLFWRLLNTGQGVAHNALFELRHLAAWFRQYLSEDPDYGVAVRAANGYFPIRSDTQVEAYLAADFQRFGLKPLTLHMFDRHGRAVAAGTYPQRTAAIAAINKIKEEDERVQALADFDGHVMTELHELFPALAKNQRPLLRFNTLPLTPQVVDYACEDSVWCLAIHQHYHPQVSGRLLYTVEKAIVEHVVPRMEDFGVAYDWTAMRSIAEFLYDFRDRLNAEIMADLSQLTGEPIAIKLSSPPQLSTVLFDKLGFKTNVYTTKTRDLPPGQRKMSTGKIALERLAKKHPVVQRIRDWREINRLLGTYLEKYQDLYDYADDGRAHPNHLSAFVITGRFAVGDPPYQQSPKKYHIDLAPARPVHAAHAEAHGPKCDCADPQFQPPAGSCFKVNFRDLICAPPGHYILGFDLSQAELRAIAGEAQEPALLEAFAAGRDVHKLTASLMLGVDVSEVTEKQRDVGKTMAFALGYGMSVRSLADRLGIPVEEAQILYDKYFAAYPAIPVWSARQVAHGQKHGYVTSKFGRKLPIWEYLSDKEYLRRGGDRACVNYPIQGAATGDLVKIMMIRAIRAIDAAGYTDRMHLVMNIHDALEFYVDSSITPADAVSVLRDAIIFDIPGWPAMKADWHIATRWGSPTKIDVNDDGTITVHGDQDFELRPSIDVDEDTGEQVEALPDIDPDVIRTIAAESGRQVVITLDQMPHPDHWRAFVDALHTSPGHNNVHIITPQGDVELPFTTNFNPEHQDRAARLLTVGVTVAYLTDQLAAPASSSA